MERPTSRTARPIAKRAEATNSNANTIKAIMAKNSLLTEEQAQKMLVLNPNAHQFILDAKSIKQLDMRLAASLQNHEDAKRKAETANKIEQNIKKVEIQQAAPKSVPSRPGRITVPTKSGVVPMNGLTEEENTALATLPKDIQAKIAKYPNAGLKRIQLKRELAKQEEVTEEPVATKVAPKAKEVVKNNDLPQRGADGKMPEWKSYLSDEEKEAVKDISLAVREGIKQVLRTKGVSAMHAEIAKLMDDEVEEEAPAKKVQARPTAQVKVQPVAAKPAEKSKYNQTTKETIHLFRHPDGRTATVHVMLYSNGNSWAVARIDADTAVVSKSDDLLVFHSIYNKLNDEGYGLVSHTEVTIR